MSNECDRFLGPNRDSDSTSIDESNADHYLSIDGMMCQKNCGSTVEKALCSVPGVTKVIVTFLKKEARVWGTVSSQLLIEAVENVGFDAVLRSHLLMQRLIVLCRVMPWASTMKARPY